MLKHLAATLAACTALCEMLERSPAGRRYLLAIMGTMIVALRLVAELAIR